MAGPMIIARLSLSAFRELAAISCFSGTRLGSSAFLAGLKKREITDFYDSDFVKGLLHKNIYETGLEQVVSGDPLISQQ